MAKTIDRTHAPACRQREAVSGVRSCSREKLDDTVREDTMLVNEVEWPEIVASVCCMEMLAGCSMNKFHHPRRRDGIWGEILAMSLGLALLTGCKKSAFVLPPPDVETVE